MGVKTSPTSEMVGIWGWDQLFSQYISTTLGGKSVSSFGRPKRDRGGYGFILVLYVGVANLRSGRDNLLPYVQSVAHRLGLQKDSPK